MESKSLESDAFQLVLKWFKEKDHFQKQNFVCDVYNSGMSTKKEIHQFCQWLLGDINIHSFPLTRKEFNDEFIKKIASVQGKDLAKQGMQYVSSKEQARLLKKSFHVKK